MGVKFSLVSNNIHATKERKPIFKPGLHQPLAGVRLVS